MSRRWAPIFFAFLLLAGCRGRVWNKARPQDRSCPPTLGPVAPSGPAAAVGPDAPDGYVPVTVGSVTPLSGGDARVELVTAARRQVVKVFVGGSEGQSLGLRMAKRAPVRPLTHDLLDSVLRELKAELVQAQIDELRDGVFIGTLVLRQDGRIIRIDARPSDAIALAVGAKAPIYMAKRVLREAATTRQDDDDDESAQPPRRR